MRSDERHQKQEDERNYENQWRDRQDFTQSATPNYDRLGYYPYDPRGGEGENLENEDYQMAVYPNTYKNYRPSEKGAVQRRYFGMGPVGYKRSEQRVWEDVCDLLTFTDDIDATHVEVSVHNCEVTLSGRVGDRYQKKLAEELAESVWGVKDVHNRLTLPSQSRSHSSKPEEQGATKGENRGTRSR